MYFKLWVEGEPPQSTDVHYRAKRGAGSFNWRMKWPVTIKPRRSFFYLTVQVRVNVGPDWEAPFTVLLPHAGLG